MDSNEIPEDTLHAAERQVCDLESRFARLPLVAKIFDRLQLELPPYLRYHTFEHTLDVFHETLLFAVLDNRSMRDMELLAIAAAYHDAGFIAQTNLNEIVGARWARGAMKEAQSYSEDEVQIVGAAIEDTQLKVKDGRLAQFPTTPLSPYLLDADLSNLGRVDFFAKADLVRAEMQIAESRENLKKIEFLLLSHQWYSLPAQRLRSKQKRVNLELLRARMA